VIARTGAMLGVVPDANRDISEADLQPMLSHVVGAEAPSGGEEQ
jgi:cell division protein FtsI (penicillin-binding protein 3)